ncbi:MAG: chemotaxis protein CheW, partial [Akkermansiaceae bacterium]
MSTVYSEAFLKLLRNELKSLRERGMDEEAAKILQRFKDRFCDVSLFTKELKERFSRWFNKQNGRRGTLWMDRFQSVFVEGEAALATMAAYIDLNPVRAGIVGD